MNSTDSAATARHLLGSLPRLVMVALGLPVLIVLADQWVMTLSRSMYQITPLIPLLFMAQVAALGICAGKFLDNVAVRVAVFAWSLALVDAVAFATIYYGRGSESQIMTYALLSGQLGLLTVWGILGAMRWVWRIPILLVALTLALMVLVQPTEGPSWAAATFEVWTVILAVQSVVMILLCTALRISGCRLAIVDTQSCVVTDDDYLQFGIKHLVFWMTAICPVLVLGRGLDWLIMDLREVVRAIQLGMVLAVVVVTATYASLGSGRLWLRLLTLIVVAPAAGAVLWKLSVWWGETFSQSRGTYYYYGFGDMGAQWIVWTVLAAGFLVCSLQVFRTTGYRLTYRR